MRNHIVMLAAALAALCSCEQSGTDDNTGAVILFGAVPESAYVGEQVSFYGDGFGDGVTGVTIGGVTAEIVSVAVDRVVATVPAGAHSGPVVVTAAAGSATFRNFRVMEEARVMSFTPATVTYDAKVYIYGYGFDLHNAWNNLVTVVSNGVESPPLRVLGGGFSDEMQMDSIQVLVENAFPNEGGAHVKVTVGPSVDISTGVIVFNGDVRIDAISPLRGGAGTEITIEGMNFIPGNLTQNTVMCGSTALTVVSVESRSKMKVKFPDGPMPDGFGLADYITVSVPNVESGVSAKKFRYDPARDFDWGSFGISYGAAADVALTQNAVDSMVNMGVRFISFRVSFSAAQGFGAAAGTLPLTGVQKTYMDNIINIKQMTAGRPENQKIKTIMVIEYPPANLSSIAPANVAATFDNIKSYTYNGSSLWDCVDGFQIFYNTNNMTTAVPDYVSKALRPAWNYIHPSGYSKVGEKLILGAGVIFNANNNNFNKAQEVLAAGLCDTLDVYCISWNLNSNAAGSAYYSRTLAASAFTTFLTSYKTVQDVCGPICMIAPETNANGASAGYTNVKDLSNAIVTLRNEFITWPTFKGISYRGWLENDTGIRSAANNLDNRSASNTETPQISHYQLYLNMVNGTMTQ